MIRYWSEYRKDTGEFTGRTMAASAQADADANRRPGCAFREGRYSRHTQRIDIKTDAVVEVDPVPPDNDHEYNTSIGRFVKKREVVEREARVQTASAAIEALERSQHRALREVALGDAEARKRLKDIDDEIAALRAVL